MGALTGKMDPNATNDVDPSGSIVATGTPGAKTVADPNQGLSGGQMFVRKAMAGALNGAGNSMQRQAGMNPAPMRMSASPATQPTQPAQPNFMAQAQQQGQQSTQPVVPTQNTGMTQTGLNGNKSPFPKGPNPSLFYGAPGGF